MRRRIAHKHTFYNDTNAESVVTMVTEKTRWKAQIIASDRPHVAHGFSDYSNLSLITTLVGLAQPLAFAFSSRSDHETNDESVQTQSLRENQNQDHANEEARLLCVGTHAGISDDPDGKVSVTRVGRVRVRLHFAVDDHRG